MTVSKQLFHVVTYESKEEKYDFYLTADIGVQNTEIEKRLLDYYRRNGYERIYFTFDPTVNDRKDSYFHVSIASLGEIDDRILKNVREHSPDELIDIGLFR